MIKPLITFLFLLQFINSSFSQTTVSLIANRDLSLGYHDNYNTANTNYGNAPQNGAFVIPGNTGGLNKNRALIDFDLSQIPSGAIITEARLNLYAYTGYSSATPISEGHLGNNSSYLRRVTSSWDEFTTTWNTQPLSTNMSEVILPQSTNSTQDYLNIDVTTLVQDMYTNPTQSHGFLLGLINEVSTNNLSFCSKEGSDQSKYPVLEITYTTCSEELTLVANRDLSLGYHDNYNTANTNYGNAPQNGAFVIPGNTGGLNKNRALIDFDLSQIPSGAIITEARLNLYAYTGYSSATPISEGHLGNNSSYLRRVTSSWDEFTTTWNTQPLSTNMSEVILPQSTNSTQDYLNIDVTTLVQDMYTNPTQSHGFLLGLINEVSTNNLSFCSKEGSDQSKYPTLTLYLDCKNNMSELSVIIDDFDLYPNPTLDILNIRFQDVGLKLVKIYALDGRLMHMENADGEILIIDTEDFKSGSYYVVIELEGKQLSKKLLKL